jgi:hypothetical protein
LRVRHARQRPDRRNRHERLRERTWLGQYRDMQRKAKESRRCARKPVTDASMLRRCRAAGYKHRRTPYTHKLGAQCGHGYEGLSPPQAALL